MIDEHIPHHLCDSREQKIMALCFPKRKLTRQFISVKGPEESIKEGYRAGSHKPTDAGVRKFCKLSKESKS